MNAVKTGTDADADVIEGLDFQYVPPCETGQGGFGFKVGSRVFSWGGNKDCGRPAAWHGRCRYCGDAAYTCQEHYATARGVWYCATCRRFLGRGRANEVIWTRL